MVVKQIGEWTEITRTYTRLEQPLGEGWIVCQHTCAWQPPTDVYEDDDGVVVRIEVAGMSGEDLSVSLTGTRGGMGCTLVVTGTRIDSAPKRMYHQMEVRFGEFRAEVDLPWSAEPEDVEADYEAGFLTIRLPRSGARCVPVVGVEREADQE